MRACTYTLLICSLLFSCKKKAEEPEPASAPVAASDTQAPVVSLNGKQKDTLFLGASYNDPGATAVDDKDGDLTLFITISGTVNSNQTGDYEKIYAVRDAAGNIGKATRQIHVRNPIAYITGNYLVACSCATANPGVDPIYTANTTYTASAVASTSASNVFVLSGLSIGTATMLTNVQIFAGGSSFIVHPSQPGMQMWPTTSYLGASKSTFTINTNGNVVSYPNKSISCQNVFTRQ